ncbi:anti-sigma factor [Naasia sp. SYSU D00948]|uniref:anti-sigma factor n=1 Tax=Naasia sp. SYSU D00948 TaxID=2817379 RepID=UPI001B30C5E2|nr:anti-sigma factor [Naasia sp. SYSU D00948]
MPHVEPDILALLALGEDVASPDELAHVEGCAECRAELSNLKRTARVGRTALGAGELLTPPPRVWDRIVAELELEDGHGAPGDETRGPAGETTLAPVEQTRSAPSEAGNPPIPIRPKRPRWFPALAAAAAAVLLVAGGAVTWQLLRPQTPAVLATAELEPFPAWVGAEGVAQLEEAGDGERVVRVTLEAPDVEGGYREVWLITSDATQLVSLGVLEGREGTFAVPDGIDTDSYDLVDISEEPLDGDPGHSGDSIVRGQLT